MGFGDLERDLRNLEKALNDSSKKKSFLKKEGKKLKQVTVNVAKSRVKEKTGNYIRGIKEGKVYEYQGNYACRVYSTMPHAHLIEYGHIQLDRSGKEHGFKKGYHVFKDSKEKFDDEFSNDVNEYVGEIFKQNNF